MKQTVLKKYKKSKMKNKLNQLYIYILLLGATLLAPIGTSSAAVPVGEKEFLGRWDIHVMGNTYNYVSMRHRYCWLELKIDNGTIKGRIQPGEGACIDITDIKIENGELSFKQANRNAATWKGTLKGKKLVGTVNSSIFGKEVRAFTGVRVPVWPSTMPARKPGKPINLIGKDVSGWLLQYPNIPIGWVVKDGILLNSGKDANNIYTKQKFKDFRLEVEFKVEPKSNGGIFLRGRYEISVLDSYGTKQTVHSQGALYGYTIPKVDANKPPSEWQTFDITIVANHVTVILNGITLLDKEEIPGITGDVLDANENNPGPLLLQGNHGPVQFRKLILTPLI